ncbi:TPA: hypothetical protein N6X17_005583, partial [Escherichia coli]|nr:hypothetical protein [Escherichia coli]
CGHFSDDVQRASPSFRVVPFSIFHCRGGMTFCGGGTTGFVATGAGVVVLLSGVPDAPVVV